MSKTLKFFAGGEWIESKTDKYYDIFNPSTGELIAKTPCCLKEEVEYAVDCAARAFQTWSRVPVAKRVAVLYRFKTLIEEHIDEITLSVCRENGKVWEEALGDVLKAKEGVEHACSMPTLMMGESLFNVTSGYDTVLYREPVGVFAGLVPFNFPAMIPFGWMTPLCIAAGNCIVLKASSMTPMTSFLLAELMEQAGLPKGVLNIVTCSRSEAEVLLRDERVAGVSFVGSTQVGKHIYKTAAEHGKRVQALCEAKNHALVMEDAVLERTAKGIINAAFGCAGERCMALPVVVAVEPIADRLAELLVGYAKELRVGAAYDKASQMGPVVSAGHKKSVSDYIALGVEEGAKLLLDGRECSVEGYENGFFLKPTIFDSVTNEMRIGCEEIFGPVLCIKRVKSFEEGVRLINASPFANGAVIFTQNGHYAREFSFLIDGGMVGVNCGIPVPMGVFPFTGHKNSFFGDLHCLGKDGVRFYTETKAVTSTWFVEEAKTDKVNTWDGMI